VHWAAFGSIRGQSAPTKCPLTPPFAFTLFDKGGLQCCPVEPMLPLKINFLECSPVRRYLYRKR